MTENERLLEPEDYLEPACPLRGERCGAAPAVRAVPQRRIAEKLDQYLTRRDDAGAERHLRYWLGEARLGHDLRGELFLCNELAGHYRKTGNGEQALRYARRAVGLLDELDYEGSATAGTTLVNAATVFAAFGENERALALFERARAVYERLPELPPHLLGGLYNNMAVAYQNLKRYAEAEALYGRALEQMGKVEGGALEQAVTCLNMADAVAEELGTEAGEARITELLNRAEALLREESVPRDSHYAYVLGKCAPTFAYYGFFAAADELKRAAEAIHEGT